MRVRVYTGGGMIYCEQCRVKQAQQSLTESILKRMSGRVVTVQDREVFEQLEKRNKQSRKKLFGCEDWVWYLKLGGWSEYGYR